MGPHRQLIEYATGLQGTPIRCGVTGLGRALKKCRALQNGGALHNGCLVRLAETTGACNETQSRPLVESSCAVKVTVVAGNPKPASRTLAAASIVAEAIAGRPADTVVDVVTLGPSLMGWGDDTVKDAVAAVQASDLVVFASPTYKATYTGVLKLFLDQFASATGLAGVVAVPLMLGAGPAHALAPELLLKPVLVELGAICPAQGLYLGETTYDQPGALDRWLGVWQPAFNRLLES